jgi:hypothetical protein
MSNGTPSDPVEARLALTSLKNTLFAPTSRYSRIETATMITPDGKTIIYLRRRFVPAPERFQLIQEHTVTQSERLDNIAARYLGDPEVFWRLADANGAMRPEDLVETVGRKLRITLPQGISGTAL